ncbi:hypothetical protein Tsubulata_027273 [Turnera subulata]|uniref:DUF4283 domain-containing protein n=1 Tax=Turnera subulata TaxID=218843 RepID=A0A9Q0JHE4_9ROSI|nr:hypothetical protein Tsubulata_027273 [Turnera subulata]
MASLWAVKKDLQISELAKNLFMFKFTDERYKKKVLDGELWNFDRHVLVLHPVEGSEQPSEIELFQTPFWIQIHDLPFQYRDPKITMMIGKKLGFLMGVYEEEGWDMETFLQVRVLIDVGQPLRRCGWLGHTMKDCTYGSDDDKEEEPQLRYNEEIRAPPFRRNCPCQKLRLSPVTERKDL